jgi:hypothetical protein
MIVQGVIKIQRDDGMQDRIQTELGMEGVDFRNDKSQSNVCGHCM